MKKRPPPLPPRKLKSRTSRHLVACPARTSFTTCTCGADKRAAEAREKLLALAKASGAAPSSDPIPLKTWGTLLTLGGLFLRVMAGDPTADGELAFHVGSQVREHLNKRVLCAHCKRGRLDSRFAELQGQAVCCFQLHVAPEAI